MNKVILDTSVLGLGYFHEQSRTGIFRVAEELFKGLHSSNEIELSLANTENLPEMLSYLKKYFPESTFNLVNNNRIKLEPDSRIRLFLFFRLSLCHKKPLEKLLYVLVGT